jgi:hypothetical protein
MASTRIGVRLDDEELALIDERADELGITRSEMIRFLIGADVLAIWMDRDEPKPECYPYVDAGFQKEFTRQINKAGTNLNQTAHRLNTLQHWAVQGKASGLDWKTYTDLARQSLETATESLYRIAEDFDLLVEHAGYCRRSGKAKGNGDARA